MGKLQLDKIRRVVVRGTNWVGDAMMTIPALRELRRVLPNAHITLATRSWAKGLFADADFIDELLPYDRRPNQLSAVMQQASEWRRRSFDLAVLFQNAFEAALIGYLARVPVRIGYRTEGRWLLLTHRLPLPDWRSTRHEIFYYLNVVAELEQLIYGKSEILKQDPVFALNVSSIRQEEAREILRRHGGRDCHPLVVLCPGSINSRAKRWPYEYYAALGDRLVEQLDADLLLVGSPDELDISEAVSRQMRKKPIMLTGQTDLAQAVAVLSLADLLVTNDTGPAHIASALGRPTLVIFGPTNPLTTRPFSQVAEIVRRPPDCAPCMLRDCPIDHRCMTAITHDEVFERARALLNKSSAAAPTDRNVCTSGVPA